MEGAMRAIKSSLLATALTAILFSGAQAAPILTYSPIAFSANSTSFDFGGGQAGYTLSSTGDFSNPVAISTTGTALVNSFGGFLGIPVTPTTNFIDRGTVTFGSSMPYTAFPVATPIPFSNGDNFVGLAFDLMDGTHYGYVQFEDTNLVGYGYESTPGATITATAITAVPEPASIFLLSGGLLLLGYRRYSQRLKPNPKRC
jgi:hypothetical protein